MIVGTGGIWRKLGGTPGCLLLCLLLCLIGAPVLAQDDPDGSHFTWYGDLRLRAERTADIPARSDDIERFRSALRAGGRWTFDSGWELAAAAKLGAGSDDNADNRRNNDNEKSNGVGLDELYAAYHFGESSSIRLGKGRMPLVLSPLLWDRDLRPVGLSLEHSASVRDFDAFHLSAAYLAGDHLYGDRSRIAAVQIGYGWMEGAETGFSTFLSYLDFDDIDRLVQEGLGRTNRRTATRFVSDFRLLDLQFIARMPVYEAPLVARLDLVRNLGADDLRNGARFSLIWGDAAQLGGWELGYSIQRAQRDAVLAAFAEDDWWFHSFARGYMPWVAYGFNPHWSMQFSGFFERRDAIADYTDRYLLDVRARW